MTRELPPTLSAYLIREARRFLNYPERTGRKKIDRLVAENWEVVGHALVEWRKTFAPAHLDDALEMIHEPARFLDEIFCREQLKSIPGMVERTRKLSHVKLSDISDTESFAYLREAANCFILGLPQAAIALARSAVEFPIVRAAARLAGKQAVAEMDLNAVMSRYGRRILTPASLSLAHKVRTAGNDVLHDQPGSSDEALQIIDAARAVVSELTVRNPRMTKPI